MKNRENFLLSDIRKLKDRVNHRCSRPGCRVQTSAPASNGRVNSIGAAAHICAASPLGPRYDKNQSPKERKSIENAIWLCNVCAREIDLDETKFPVSLLNEWKAEAEKLTAQELGVRVAVKDNPMDSLAAALTGMPRKILFDSISNVHFATGKAWENLDPRFNVETQFVNGTQILGLHAKENVDFQMAIMPEFIEEFSKKFTSLIDHGKELSIETGGLVISGLPILEEILPKFKGQLFIKPIGIKARTKIILCDSFSGSMEQIEDVLGEISIGKTNFSFIGNACNKILNIDYSIPLDGYSPIIKFNIKLSFYPWYGKNILELTYFKKIFDFIKNLHTNWKMQLLLEVEGDIALKGNLTNFDDPEFIENQYFYLSYIDMCRNLSKLLKIPVLYDADFGFDGETYHKLSKIISRMENKCIFYKDKIISNPKCVLTLPVENVQLLFKQDAAIKYVANQVDSIDLFGVDFMLPPVVHTFHGVTPVIIQTLSANDKEMSLEVEFIPGSNFRYEETYDI